MILASMGALQTILGRGGGDDGGGPWDVGLDGGPPELLSVWETRMRVDSS